MRRPVVPSWPSTKTRVAMAGFSEGIDSIKQSGRLPARRRDWADNGQSSWRRRNRRVSAWASKRCSAPVSSTSSPRRPKPTASRTRLALDQLQPGRYQPRTRMDEGALYELAESIKAQGVMQPVLVRPLARRAATAPALRDHRRRAALPRRPPGRARRRAGARARRLRRGRGGDGADREHPARGPEPARGGARPAPPDRRVRHDPRGGGARRRPLAQRGDQPAAPAAT